MTILAVSAILYGGSAAAYIADLYGAEARLLGWCLAGAGALGGVLAVLLGLVPLRGAALPVESLTWLLVANFLIADGFLGLRAAGAMLMPVVTLASLVPLLLVVHDASAGARLSGLHLFAALFAYGAFALAFAASGLYLVQERALRRRAFQGPYRRVPPLLWLDRAAHGLIAYGLPMLLIAAVTNMRRGPWPVAGTLAVMVPYGGYLLARARGDLVGRGAAKVAVWGFTGVLVNLLVLSLLVNSV
jgi:ABC-type uncharacterized transport system permease subunit